ncbi:MAG TPA: HAMP domain-containing sensor histidine kinase, partial [Candidatus Dormibacteraeota bacterium]|nr:HAMP domain-containing sensor histidine kinase [Candidatus Dormibacteraeota bacterium]
ALFVALVTNNQADAVICFDQTGAVVYPRPTTAANTGSTWNDRALAAQLRDAQNAESFSPETAAASYANIAAQATNTDLAARALQGQARCFALSGKKEQALETLIGVLGQERFARATDEQGRVIVPNAELRALELLNNSTNSQTQAVLRKLKEQLTNYHTSSIPSAQRRFLMRELLRLFPNQVEFPTLPAEDLAARYLDAASPSQTEPVLKQAPLPDLWQFSSAHGRVLVLHHTDALLQRLASSVSPQLLPADLKLSLLPPGKVPDQALLSMLAGPLLPGWRLALDLKERHLFETAAEQRIALYVWSGTLVLLTVLVLALLVFRLIAKQLALTQLRNDLVANVTHELKTPLSSMRLLVDTLLASPQLNEKTAREYLDLIAKENVRLSRLIDNFLTFSRIERNKYTFRFASVKPSALVEASAAAVRDRFTSPGCSFKVESGPESPVVADSDAIVAALVNLLDNAYKYTGEEKRITLTAHAQNGHVRFAIADNGIGLSPRETRRIFKRFYQVDQRLSRGAGGCGLGLSIVQFIVKAHHGDIQVQSEPGKGSTFVISLPAAETNPSLN